MSSSTTQRFRPFGGVHVESGRGGTNVLDTIQLVARLAIDLHDAPQGAGAKVQQASRVGPRRVEEAASGTGRALSETEHATYQGPRKGWLMPLNLQGAINRPWRVLV